jgi:hypothetical protein
MATKAAIELNGENSAQVLVFLEAATPCELGEPLPFEMGTLYPAYLRGKAYLLAQLEVPSGGAVGTARAIAHAYSVFATGGRELGLRPETLELLAACDSSDTRVLR